MTEPTFEITPGSGAPMGEGLRWRAKARVEKYDRPVTPEEINDPGVRPDDVIEREGNLLMIGGASAIWQRFIGTGIGAFSNALAQLGVGDSVAAASEAQTDLQASTNKVWKALDATYPLHTDSTSSTTAKSITYRSTFGTSDGNFEWREWGLRNGDGTPRMLNRKVESLGTKGAGSTWVLTITLGFA